MSIVTTVGMKMMQVQVTSAMNIAANDINKEHING